MNGDSNERFAGCGGGGNGGSGGGSGISKYREDIAAGIYASINRPDLQQQHLDLSAMIVERGDVGRVVETTGAGGGGGGVIEPPDSDDASESSVESQSGAVRPAAGRRDSAAGRVADLDGACNASPSSLGATSKVDISPEVLV